MFILRLVDKKLLQYLPKLNIELATLMFRALHGHNLENCLDNDDDKVSMVLKISNYEFRNFEARVWL